MKVKVSRKREGKKLVEAPKQIKVYNDKGDYIAAIHFGNSFNELSVFTIDGSQIRCSLHESHDGKPIELNERNDTRWAHVGEITRRN